MKLEFTRSMKFFIFSVIGAFAFGILTGCTAQLAFKNKHTDCGFTNDRIQPGGRKDPTIFYGPPKG